MSELEEISDQETQDTIARASRELQTAYSENGLVESARRVLIQERKARRLEAFVESGGQRTFQWALSRLSSFFTGYGVQLKPVVTWMLALYLLSAYVYWKVGGMAWDQSLYYSIVTFTTAPPETPPNYVTSIVAGIQTFAGTTGIVFLGYVIGSRNRI